VGLFLFDNFLSLVTAQQEWSLSGPLVFMGLTGMDLNHYSPF
jgi:hypothetical protein